MLRILRVVGSRSLKCGCFVGLYETYNGLNVEIVDDRGRRCTDASHTTGHVTRVVSPCFNRKRVRLSAG